MITKKTSLFVIPGLFLIGFILSLSTQETVLAKSQKPTIIETVTPAETPTGVQEPGENNKGVSSFVQNLLSVADRNTGIGESVRIIARQQNDSEKAVTEEINTIENRNKIITFFIGTDYKNLGALRSEMVKTDNQIDQITRLVDKTTNIEDKTILQNQITALQQEQTKINDFITQNESKFSLLGWLVKFFQ